MEDHFITRMDPADIINMSAEQVRQISPEIISEVLGLGKHERRLAALISHYRAGRLDITQQLAFERAGGLGISDIDLGPPLTSGAIEDLNARDTLPPASGLTGADAQGWNRPPRTDKPIPKP